MVKGSRLMINGDGAIVVSVPDIHRGDRIDSQGPRIDSQGARIDSQGQAPGLCYNTPSGLLNAL